MNYLEVVDISRGRRPSEMFTTEGMVFNGEGCATIVLLLYSGEKKNYDVRRKENEKKRKKRKRKKFSWLDFNLVPLGCEE